MAADKRNYVFFVENTSRTAHPLTAVIGTGTGRRYVIFANREAGLAVTGATFNGQAMTQRLAVTNPGDAACISYAFDYEIPDGLADGNYDVVVTTTNATTEITLDAWEVTGAITGAPEVATSNTANNAATTVAVAPVVTAGSVSLASVMSGSGTPTANWSADITEEPTGQHNAASYSVCVASKQQAGAATLNVTATMSSSAGFKNLLFLSYAAGPTGPDPDSLDVEEGSAEGGTEVTITGTNFSAAGGSSEGVTFGGVAATDVVFVSATEITCTTPAHAAGAVDVVVTNGDGQTGTLDDGFFYEGEVSVEDPGLTNASGDAVPPGILTSTLWPSSGMKKYTKLTAIIDGVAAEPRCVLLEEP